jgi:hypothetical protein
MEWLFVVTYDRRDIKLKAKVIYLTEQIERVQVSGRNRSITLQSNRPFLENKGLKHKRIDWKLIDGQFNNSHLLQKIVDSVEYYLRHIDKQPRQAKPYKK